MGNEKQVAAAKKAVHTRRMNLLAATAPGEVERLCREIKQQEEDIDLDMSREAIIAREVAKTTWASFKRFGDKNRATAGLILYWIGKKGTPLDLQSLWIESNYGIEIGPDELAMFICEHDRGKSMYEPYRKLADLYQTFKEKTGFKWNRKFINKVINLQVQQPVISGGWAGVEVDFF